MGFDPGTSGKTGASPARPPIDTQTVTGAQSTDSALETTEQHNGARQGSAPYGTLAGLPASRTDQGNFSVRPLAEGTSTIRQSIPPALARDRLVAASATVTRLPEFSSVLALIGDLDSELRHTPLTALADRIEHLPLEERTEAFTAHLERASRLSQETCAGPLMRLGFQIADLPELDRRAAFDQVSVMIDSAYQENKVTAQDYARTLAALAYSLAALEDSHQIAVTTPLLAAIARLPAENQAFPIQGLGYRIGSLSSAVRDAVFADAWGKTERIGPHHNAAALTGLSSAVHTLSDFENRQTAFDRIFEATIALDERLHGEILKNLSAQLGYLPEQGRKTAFDKVWDAATPAHGKHYENTLQQLATAVATLPPETRTSDFDRIHAAANHLGEQARAVALVKLGEVIAFLWPQDQFSRLLSIISEVQQPPCAALPPQGGAA